MTKTLLAVAIGALAVASTASANWYVQGDLGYSKVKFDKLNKSKFTPSLAVGYRLNDFRLALDYTNYGKRSYSYYWTEQNEIVSGKGDLKAQSIGFSAIYDINLNSNVTPYVGIRLASNILSYKESSTSTRVVNNTVNAYHSESETKAAVGYGAFAGVSYKLAQNLSVLGTVEYNNLGKFDDINVKQYGAKVGIRYEF